MTAKAFARAFFAILVGSAAFVATATPAHAVDIPVTCQATLNGAPLATVDQTFSLSMNAPPQVVPGETFTMTIPASTFDLPATSPPPQSLPIASYSDLSTSFRVTGGTPVPGSASVPEATIAGDLITLATAGPVPPGPFSIPAVSFQVTAGTAGTTITTSAVNVILTINLEVGISPLLTCDLPPNTLSSTQVVTPGAPSANDTTVSTPAGTPVPIDLNALITPAAGVDVDPTSLAITAQPSMGTVTLADGVVTYTPDPGAAGTDTFTYQVCSIAIDPATPPACDVGTVTVNVVAPPTPQTTPPMSPPAATAVSTLPRTGGGPGALVVGGVVLVFAGAALAGVSRRFGASLHARRA